MKISLSSKGDNLDSELDPRFGRAQYFIVVDSETKDFKIIRNEQNINARQGAGIQAAKTIIESGAKVLITKNCGPKAFDVLNAQGIKVAIISKETTIKNAMEKFLAGELKIADNANVDGHW
ncbi:MAG: dinitrogenase iron-molybdenum cofactor biosynthesis protein [Desulfobacteraceae bacterium 4572_130]|nr:MAG: dinitrogenase iron-molybdenum cofactor biosynthesis protein [Desulfobacteraceae bacterium 4572_130]